MDDPDSPRRSPTPHVDEPPSDAAPASAGDEPPPADAPVPPASAGNEPPPADAPVPPASAGDEPPPADAPVPPASAGDEPPPADAPAPPASAGDEPPPADAPVPPASAGDEPPPADAPAPPASAGDEPPLADAPVPPASAGDEPPPADAPAPAPAPAPPSPPSARSSSPSSDSGQEEPLPTARLSQVRWADPVPDGHTTDEPASPSDPGGRPGDLSAMADPLVYDATRAAVGAVLGHAAGLLQAGALPQLHANPGALSAAAELLRRVLSTARRNLETAAGSVHHLLPLGVRLAENVMTVPQWRAVEARSRQCARRAIYQALLELELPQERQEEDRLLRAIRRRPARLWADISLEEAAAELAAGRPPDRYPGFDTGLDAGREAEEALLTAYRAAARAQMTEPVPAVPLPPAAGLDAAERLAAVHDVVKSWRYSVGWRYCVDFLRTEEEPLLSRHVYQVRFSVPERHQPVPRPVAYVFFVLTVSNVKPATEPIQMYYMMETSRLRHVPGKVIFQEKWLIDIINVKLKFWREIKF